MAVNSETVSKQSSSKENMYLKNQLLTVDRVENLDKNMDFMKKNDNYNDT